jgi:hypothetical protein
VRDDSDAQRFAPLDREQPVQFGFNTNVTGGRSRPVSFAFTRLEVHTTRDEIEACRKAPRNYKWGLIYYCKADPRAIVPRRYKWMGWTVNFARRAQSRG